MISVVELFLLGAFLINCDYFIRIDGCVSVVEFIIITDQIESSNTPD